MLQREMVNVGGEELLSMREADRVGSLPWGKAITQVELVCLALEACI